MKELFWKLSGYLVHYISPHAPPNGTYPIILSTHCFIYCIMYLTYFSLVPLYVTNGNIKIKRWEYYWMLYNAIICLQQTERVLRMFYLLKIFVRLLFQILSTSSLSWFHSVLVVARKCVSLFVSRDLTIW